MKHFFQFYFQEEEELCQNMSEGSVFPRDLDELPELSDVDSRLQSLVSVWPEREEQELLPSGQDEQE